MNVPQLSAALEIVLANPRVKGTVSDVWVHLHFQEHSAGRPGPLDPLLKQIEDDPGLAPYQGQMIVLPGLAMLTTPLQLAVALVDRAQRQSVEDAIAGLQRYLDTDDLPVHWLVALEGVSVNERHELGPDLALIPLAQLPPAQLERFTEIFGFQSIMPSRPGAFVQRTLTVRRTHVSPGTAHVAPRDGALTPTDLLLCLGLIGPCAPSVSAQWFAPVDWWPTVGQGAEYPPPRWPHGADKLLTAADVGLGVSYHRRFLALSNEDRDRMRIPLERLNIALQRLSETDKIIDLGIALEALLLTDTGDDRGEPTFKVQVRGAWLMGKNRAERVDLADTLRGLYHLRNKAVHSGHIPPNHAGRPIQRWIEEGARLVAQCIVKVLNDGIPSPEHWRSLVVGS